MKYLFSALFILLTIFSWAFDAQGSSSLTRGTVEVVLEDSGIEENLETMSILDSGSFFISGSEIVVSYSETKLIESIYFDPSDKTFHTRLAPVTQRGTIVLFQVENRSAQFTFESLNHLRFNRVEPLEDGEFVINVFLDEEFEVLLAQFFFKR
jgi:hypothetical protein